MKGKEERRMGRELYSEGRWNEPRAEEKKKGIKKMREEVEQTG